MITVIFEIEPLSANGAMATARLQINGQVSQPELVVTTALLTVAQLLGEEKVAKFLENNYGNELSTTMDTLEEKIDAKPHNKKSDKADWTTFCG